MIKCNQKSEGKEDFFLHDDILVFSTGQRKEMVDKVENKSGGETDIPHARCSFFLFHLRFFQEFNLIKNTLLMLHLVTVLFYTNIIF